MVGQSVKDLMPSRRASLCSTSTPTKSTPRWSRIWTLTAEKPQRGSSGTPFMKSTTGWSATVLEMKSWTGLAVAASVIRVALSAQNRSCRRWGCRSRGSMPSPPPALRRTVPLSRTRERKASGWRAGFEGQGVEFAAHLALQRGVDELVLAHARQAGERRRDDAGLVVVAVAGEVLDLDRGVGEALAQDGFEVGLGHRHGRAFS